VARDDDSSTLKRPLEPPTGVLRAPVVPALTILLHPDIERVGEVALLQDNRLEGLTRDAPTFFVPGSNVGRPIADRLMNRDPVLHFVWAQGRLDVRPGSADITADEVRIDGEPFDRACQFDLEELRRGIIVTVARAFVFCLHSIRYPVTRSSSLGLVGSSDAVEDVRCAITRAAGRATTVLIRGESGTGKELVARALHESGPRPNGPFVVENASRLQGERADDMLFGHERGAFTGATDSQPGLFRAAHNGTLFIDELGDLPRKTQPILLRVVQDGVVQPLSSVRSRKVDVFVVAATNADLEAAVTAGTFDEALYHRFNTAINITVPPLRERREDVGLLLVHFLRIYLDADLQHLQDQTPDSPWLAARDVAALAMHSWRDNVRGVEGIAKKLAIDAGPGAHQNAHEVIKEFLAKAAKLPPPDGRPSAASSIPASRDLLLSALERSDWNCARAAELLGISPATFSRRLREDPELHKVTRLRIADLIRAEREAKGDVEIAAKRLGVPPDLLARRLRRRR
jgi:two-component system, NtrC family, nitrogen regulation response regulator GlnG